MIKMTQTQIKSEEKQLRELAKKKIIKRTLLKSHFFIYVIVNIFLLTLNFLIDYSYPWYLWNLSGWGLGLSIHALGYSISNRKIRTKNVKFFLYNIGIYCAVNIYLLFINWFINSGTLTWFYITWTSWSWGLLTLFVCFSYIQFQKYHTNERIAITVHFIIYISTNIYLYLVNIVGNDYTYPWHLWALFGWGIGLIFHQFVFSIQRLNKDKQTTAIAFHITVYFTVNTYCIFNNLFTNIFHNTSYLWFIWPLLSWLPGLLVHFMIYLENRPRKKQKKKELREQRIQAEIIKLREIREISIK
jgi:hypothetical protein